MSERNWTRTEESRPPDGAEVEAMDGSGRVTNLTFYRGMWWLPDRSMYVYYVPQFWKPRRPK